MSKQKISTADTKQQASLSRRKLLQGAGLTSLTAGTGLLSTLGSFQAHATVQNDYKALVCVYLRGGMDCHDSLLPYNISSYDRYAKIRAPLLNQYRDDSRARENLLPLSTQTHTYDQQYALPQQLRAMQHLFHERKAAIIANVGPLMTPTVRSQFKDKSVSLPQHLFSHDHQKNTWHTLDLNHQSGWGARFADYAYAQGKNTSPTFSTISLANNTQFLTGHFVKPYILKGGKALEIRELIHDHLLGSGRNSDVAKQLLREHFQATGFTGNNLFQQDIIDTYQRSLDASKTFNQNYERHTPIQTVFPNTELGKQLKAIAEIISLRGSLGAGRQVFYASIGGFDTHNGQVNSLSRRHVDIAESIAAFHQTTQELNLENNVTLFTASDFGRTLAVNGDGSDHGWGGHHFVVGGAVKGGDIFGQVPDYDFDHDFDAGRGRLIPSLSLEQYAAPFGRWFGLSPEELHQTLPNLQNFDEHAVNFMDFG